MMRKRGAISDRREDHGLMPEHEKLRVALEELDLLRRREAMALRDSQAYFRVLDRIVGKQTIQEALGGMLDVVKFEFGADTVLLCRSMPNADAVSVELQRGLLFASDRLSVEQAFIGRSRRLLDPSVLAPDGLMNGARAAIMAPLTITGEPQMALICLSTDRDRFHLEDLGRLTQMAKVAAQPLAALRLSRRAAELAALIDGRTPSLSDDLPEPMVDKPFEAVNRAFDRLTQTQGLVVGLLNDLLAAPAAELDATIDATLARLGVQCGLDRSYIFAVHDGQHLERIHEYVGPGVQPLGLGHTGYDLGCMASWVDDLQAGRDIRVLDTKLLRDDQPERQFLQHFGVQSLLLMPMIEHGQIKGLVAFEAIHTARVFLPGEVHLLRSVTNAMGSVLRRRQVERMNAIAQEALALERSRLQATLSALPDLVIELNEEGRFTEHYSNANTVMSNVASRLMGRTMRDSLDPDLAQMGHKMLAELATTGRTGEQTFQYDLGNNDLRWIKAHAVRREAGQEDGTPGFLFVLRDITHEINQAEEIARLGQMVKRSSNLVVVTDIERRINWVNDSFVRRTGWTMDEVVGRKPSDFLQPPDVDRTTLSRIRMALDAGRPCHEELLNISRDGTRYWVEIDIQPIRNEAGELTGFMSIETDITQRKEHEAAIAVAAAEARLAQERLVAAVESLEDGFVFFDRKGKLVLCNSRYREMSLGMAAVLKPGVSREDIYRYGLKIGHYQDAIGSEDAWLQARLESADQSSVESEVRLSDGRWLRVYDKRTPDGGTVGLRVDITALKEAEARALSDRAAAMDASHDGMAISAPDGAFLFANPAFIALFAGTRHTTLVGRVWSEVMGTEATYQILERAVPALGVSGQNWRGEVTLPRQTGAPAEIELSLTRRVDGALVWVARDLAERRHSERESHRLREELQLAQRREVIGQLAAGLAHDFNNLIAAISGSATLILSDEGKGAAERARDHAIRIQKSAERAEAMVRRLLALGARPASHRTTDLVPVLREAADLLRPGLGQSVRLMLDLPQTPLMTTLEPTDVLQIVLNLGINARDAMAHAGIAPQDRIISLRLRDATLNDIVGNSNFRMGSADPARAYACLTVSDTGPGIPEAVMERIFTPYFSTKGEKGSGLGLAIVSGVIKAAEGAISLASRPGEGAEFTVLLPLAVEGAAQAADPLSAYATEPMLARPAPGPARVQAPAAKPAPKAPVPFAPPLRTGGQLKGKSILIVDDAEDVLSVLAHMLEREGAEVAPTSDAEAAFEVLDEDPEAFDLVITDFDMGVLTGADLAREAHKLRPDLPVILITALPDWRVRDARGGGDPSFFTVLGKPVAVEALVAAAVGALDSAKN